MHMCSLFLLTTNTILALASCGINTTEEKKNEPSETKLSIQQKELEPNTNDFPKITQKDKFIGQEQEFEIPLGKSTYGFSYSNYGELTFNGIKFTPNVISSTTNVPKFKISFLDTEQIAGAIAMDIDGQNYLFFLDLSTMTAVAMQETKSWNAAREIYWSPSRKYMVAWCAYEGEFFIRIDTESKEILTNALKSDSNQETMWQVDNEPRWSGNEDIMIFNVAEYCNPFVIDCGDAFDKVLSKFKVSLDAATLRISKTNS
jgi:hypothetical protein